MSISLLIPEGVIEDLKDAEHQHQAAQAINQPWIRASIGRGLLKDPSRRENSPAQALTPSLPKGGMDDFLPKGGMDDTEIAAVIEEAKIG